MPKPEQAPMTQESKHGHSLDVECPLCFKEKDYEAQRQEVDVELGLLAETSGKDAESLKNTFENLGMEAVKEELGSAAEELGVQMHLDNLEKAWKKLVPLKADLKKATEAREQAEAVDMSAEAEMEEDNKGEKAA